MSQSDFFSVAPWREQMLVGGRVVVWFSCGATSAVAGYLAKKKYNGKRPVHMVYTDPRSEDADNPRFLSDCERWLDHKIEILGSKVFQDVDDVIDKTRFLRGPNGAKCTGVLKKALRHEYQRAESDIQVFGFDASEKDRARDFQQNNPEVVLECPLIEQNLTHAECVSIIRAVGIEIPAMYRKGYKHNNCPGCVKGEGAGYWNKIRVDYPEVFWNRAKQERELGYALCRLKGKPVFLDELDPSAGNYKTEKEAPCGIICETIKQESVEACEL